MKKIHIILVVIFILYNISLYTENEEFTEARCENLIFTNADLFLEKCDVDKTFETILNIKKWKWNL